MTKIDFDLDRSLQELEGVDWGEPDYPSSLVIECHRLHRTALRDFEVKDIQRMIGQQMCLPYLVPLALRKLHERPHAEGDLYEGALLNAVLSIEAAFWKARPDLAADILKLLNNLSYRLNQMASFERNGVLAVLDEQGHVFLARCGIASASLVDYGKPEKNAEWTDDDFTALAAKLGGHLDAEEDDIIDGQNPPQLPPH